MLISSTFTLVYFPGFIHSDLFIHLQFLMIIIHTDTSSFTPMFRHSHQYFAIHTNISSSTPNLNIHSIRLQRGYCLQVGAPGGGCGIACDLAHWSIAWVIAWTSGWSGVYPPGGYGPWVCGTLAHGLLGPSSTRVSGTEIQSHPAGHNPGRNLHWGKGIGGGHAPLDGSSSREALAPSSFASRASVELRVVVWDSRHCQPPSPPERLISGPTRLPPPLVAVTVQGQVEPATNAEFGWPAPRFFVPP